MRGAISCPRSRCGERARRGGRRGGLTDDVGFGDVLDLALLRCSHESVTVSTSMETVRSRLQATKTVREGGERAHLVAEALGKAPAALFCRELGGVGHCGRRFG